MRAACLTMWAVGTLMFGDSYAEPIACLIEPYQEAEIGSQVIGTIEHVLVERGDFVQKGQATAALAQTKNASASPSSRVK